jgi:hypothetical protein
MKKKLSETFKPTKYTLENEGKLVIEGKKIAPPSKRIVFHQKNLKILNAKLLYKGKKEDQEIIITRINHLNSVEQVRLHTNQTLYPGEYKISLNYISKLELPTEIPKNISWRELFPSIDEPESRALTPLEIIRA